MGNNLWFWFTKSNNNLSCVWLKALRTWGILKWEIIQRFCGVLLLRSNNNKDVPDWKKAAILKGFNVNISYGADNTGNLYNPDNILHLKKEVGFNLDFITGDGGFDFLTILIIKNNWDRIIYSQTVSAQLFKKEGSFI